MEAEIVSVLTAIVHEGQQRSQQIYRAYKRLTSQSGGGPRGVDLHRGVRQRTLNSERCCDRYETPSLGARIEVDIHHLVAKIDVTHPLGANIGRIQPEKVNAKLARSRSKDIYIYVR